MRGCESGEFIGRRNGVNTHGGNKRIVIGDRENGVLEGSFNELILGLGIMPYQSVKGGFEHQQQHSTCMYNFGDVTGEYRSRRPRSFLTS